MNSRLVSMYICRRSITTASRLRGFDAPTVWQEFTPLSIKHKSVNLGQGFPDWESPMFVKDALAKSVLGNFNQYCRSGGELSLVTELAKHYSPLINRNIDPLNEITTSVGATEGIFAIMQSLINEGDEVVVLEPAFDIYPAQIQMAGGICKYVSLEYDNNSRKWLLDMNKLESSISKKTKLILINSPHNPCGKVFTLSELEELASIVARNPQVTVVMDEVYEKLIYDNKKHVRFASLPNMWDRTLTVSSCGKTFSCTGWKVGWIYGAAHLIKPIMLANQWVQFCVSTPTQQAVAKIIEQSSQPYEGYPSYYDWVCNQYEKKRDHLVKSLQMGHLDPIVPEGGFFIIANTSKHKFPEKYLLEPGPSGESPVTRDWGFARWLTTEVGVTPIPPSAFYIEGSKHHAKDFARFAFCKTDESLIEARVRLDRLGRKTM